MIVVHSVGLGVRTMHSVSTLGPPQQLLQIEDFIITL